MSDTPEHRTAITARSGDTHVIGDDGVAVNVDQAARDKAAGDAAAEEAKTAKKAARPAPATDEPTPAA